MMSKFLKIATVVICSIGLAEAMDQKKVDDAVKQFQDAVKNAPDMDEAAKKTLTDGLKAALLDDDEKKAFEDATQKPGEEPKEKTDPKPAGDEKTAEALQTEIQKHCMGLPEFKKSYDELTTAPVPVPVVDDALTKAVTKATADLATAEAGTDEDAKKTAKDALDKATKAVSDETAKMATVDPAELGKKAAEALAKQKNLIEAEKAALKEVKEMFKGVKVEEMKEEDCAKYYKLLKDNMPGDDDTGNCCSVVMAIVGAIVAVAVVILLLLFMCGKESSEEEADLSASGDDL